LFLSRLDILIVHAAPVSRLWESLADGLPEAGPETIPIRQAALYAAEQGYGRRDAAKKARSPHCEKDLNQSTSSKPKCTE
jgi:hypothetical protein